jgi:muramoyltetrapeptide carboxypeptidase
MDRKHFLTASALAAASTIPFKKTIASFADEEEVFYKIPPYLRQGSVIGITSPAGPITIEEMKPAIQLMESWGYRISIGKTIGKKDFNLGGTDEERLNDLQDMLDDPDIDAIMCARGGYGSIRIVDKLKWNKFKSKPKWLIGFSDITVLHNHIHNNCHVASIHSKMTNSFPDIWSSAEPMIRETINSINDALSGKNMAYAIPSHPMNRLGTADGILIGGNLKTIETLAGSSSDIKTSGKILFVEDTGEYLYSIDRMFWNLKRTDKLDGLKGLIIGGFRIKPDDPGEEFGRGLHEIVMEKVKTFKYPVCFDFPVGHQRPNFALKCGVKHRLSVGKETVSLNEVRV